MDDLPEGTSVQSLSLGCCLAMVGLWGGLTTLGCSGSSLGVPVPKFDAEASAEAVIEQYDTDGDKLLDAEEIAACVSLAESARSIDTSGDGLVSSEEIADRIRSFASSGMGVVRVVCQVFLDKRPLVGADVILQPAEFHGDSIVSASGMTMDHGRCGVSMDPELLPKELKRVRGVQPGFYKVLITHDRIDIPERYNKQTTLGVEVSQKLIGDRGVRFDLKKK